MRDILSQFHRIVESPYQGLDLVSFPVGTRIAVGEEVVLEVSQIGKECHAKCAIFHQIGNCVMPREGVFARVIRGGDVRPATRWWLRRVVRGEGE